VNEKKGEKKQEMARLKNPGLFFFNDKSRNSQMLSCEKCLPFFWWGKFNQN
jgi:hypothetical protein